MTLSPRDRRLLLIMAPVALLAVVVLLLVVVNGSKGDQTPGLSGPNVAAGLAQQAPRTSPSPSPSPSTNEELVFTGRDPFRPLVTPTAAPTPSPSPSPSPLPTSTIGSTIDIGGHTVTLDAIYVIGSSTEVQVEVDGVIYPVVAVGQTFATDFTLVSVSNTIATFQYQTQTFQLTPP